MPDAMLRSSFIMLDRVSARTEQDWWRQGVSDWERFAVAEKINGVGNVRKSFYERCLVQAEQALQRRDWRLLAALIPQREHWRLLPLFENVCYLDIETSGWYGDVTVLGCYDGSEFTAFVRGRNLEKELVARYLLRFDALVTFNGASFDLPVLRRYFRGALPSVPHIDLRHVAARVGLTGGLKTIERILDIARNTDVEGLCGDDAVLLWQQFVMTGEEEFLESLVAYNEADCRNLEPLARIVVDRLWASLRAEM